MATTRLAPVTLANQTHPLMHHNTIVNSENGAPPCTTLFVANLGHNTTEEELRQIFSRIHSFRRLKMLRNKGTTPVSFVEYGDIIAAVHAKNLLHGQALFTSENGGMRIEFARNRMGESGRKNEPIPITDIQVQG